MYVPIHMSYSSERERMILLEQDATSNFKMQKLMSLESMK